MKKRLAITIMLVLATFITTNMAFAGGVLKFGIDFSGDHELSGAGQSMSFDNETGISFSGEIFASINPNFDLGGGLTYQVPRSVEDYEGEFNFVPIYGMMRFKSSAEKVAPYGIVQLGYNILFDGDSSYKGPADLDGGLYYGIGGGIILNKHFLIELLYSVNQGDFSLLGVSLDVENKQFTLNIGYNF